MRKATVLCLATAASLAAIGSGTIPGTDITYDHIMLSGSQALTTGTAGRWSDDYTIAAGDTGVVLYVPADLTAGTSSATETVVPIVYVSGSVYPKQSGTRSTTFNDLRLLDGAFIEGRQIGPKAGNITILATDPDNPAKYDWMRTDADYRYPCNLKAALTGAADSQFLFISSTGAKVNIWPNGGADWSGFYGTFRIEGEGCGITNDTNKAISMPGTMKLPVGGSLLLLNNNAPYTFGNLYFTEGGAITNTGSGSTLTVSGTFDTGTNMTWLSRNPGTFGTLILGDGLLLTDTASSPTTVLTVTNSLEIGQNVTIEYPTVALSSGKLLVMKLSPEVVAGGMPDFSNVDVSLMGEPAFLSTEADPDVTGGVLVYASVNMVYYNGPDEWTYRETLAGKWIDPDFSPAYWDDGLYPDDRSKIYCTTQVVSFSGASTEFPGKTLIIKEWLYLYADGYVEDLRVQRNGLYFRDSGVHFRGSVMASGGTRAMRGLGNREYYVDAVIHGTSAFNFDSYQPTASGGVTFYLNGDNSGWTGNLRTEWTKGASSPDPSETYHTRIVVGDAKALGGNQADFVYNKIALSDYAEIHFTTSTVTAVNRGFHVALGIFRVDEGAKVNIMAAISPRGTLYKTGAGTLEFGGGFMCRDKEAENFIVVQEGAIKCASLDIAKVTFSNNTEIVSSSSTGAMDLTAATITAEGSVYLNVDDEEPVDVETYPVVCPVVKVTDTQAAALASVFKTRRAPWTGWAGELVSESDGEGTTVFSIKYTKPGSAILLR